MEDFMRQSFHTILSTFDQVFPKHSFVVLILIALIFGIIISRKKRSAPGSLFMAYSLCILVLFFLPPVQIIIGKFMRGGFVYWRFLWLFPYAMVIAYAAVRLTELFPKLLPKVLCCAAIAVTILFSGKIVYNQEVFQKATNREKFPDIVPETVSVVQQNSRSTGNPYKKLMAPLDVLNKTRQYDATIYNATERVIFPQDIPQDPTQPWDDIVRTFGGVQTYDPNVIPEGLKWLQANYALMPDSFNAAPSMSKAGWKLIYERDGWQIWYEPDVVRSV